MAIAALHAGSDDADCRFGAIHPRQHVIAYSIRAHWRISLALLLLAAGSTCLLTETITHSVGHLPKPQKSVVLARSRRQPVATPKAGRVWMPEISSAPRKLDLIERMDDGSLAHSSYFNVSLDLSAADEKASPLLAAYQDGRSEDDPFGLVLRASHGDGSAANAPADVATKQRRLGPVLGEPINVSVAPVKPAGAVRRLVSMPAHDEPLINIEGAVDIPAQEFAALAADLGAGSVKAGEELDLLVREGREGADSLQIIFVRHKSRNGTERLLARRDNGHFQAVSDRRLYDRLLAEALAAEDAKRSAKSTAKPQDVKALSRAQQDYPKLVSHLRHSNVPSRVGVQVVDLLRKNGIQWEGEEKEPVIDVVFRKTEDGLEDLVSVAVNEGGHVRHFYRYAASDDGEAEYFDDRGRSVSKQLMHKPVPAGKLGDGFGWRVHPILKVRKFHNGVDYRAPQGSPILAAGDGVVIKISSEPGYGKYVRIRHDGGYTTTYAHIAGTPKGLSVGQHVSQGEVIAYVGSTGLSTGPHLYYELRVGDRYADPTKAQMSAGTTLKGRALDEFQSQVKRVESIANAIKTSATSAAEAVAQALRPGARQRAD